MNPGQLGGGSTELSEEVAVSEGTSRIPVTVDALVKAALRTMIMVYDDAPTFRGEGTAFRDRRGGGDHP